MSPSKKLYEVSSKIAGLGDKNLKLVAKSSKNITKLRRKTMESLLLLKKMNEKNYKEDEKGEKGEEDKKGEEDEEDEEEEENGDGKDRDHEVRRLSDANLNLSQENTKLKAKIRRF